MPAPLVDLAALRAYLVAHAVQLLDDVDLRTDGSSRHRRLVPTPGGPVVIAVDLPAAVVGTPVVEVEGDPGQGGAAALAAGHRWLGLDADPGAAVEALADDPVLGPLVTARPHLRVPGAGDPFEAAVNVVLGQHVSLAAGRVFAGRLAAAHGVKAPNHDRRDPGLVGHPGPEVLAALDPDELRASVGVTAAWPSSTSGPTTPSTRQPPANVGEDRRPGEACTHVRTRTSGVASGRCRCEDGQCPGAPVPRRGDRPAHPQAG